MQHIQFDYNRQTRIGLPEAVFCEGKAPHIILELLMKFSNISQKNTLIADNKTSEVEKTQARDLKSTEDVEHKKQAQSILFTRLDERVFRSFPKDIQEGVDYHPLSRTAFAFPLPPHTSHKKVALISAGSADAPVLWEAARTLQYLGITYKTFEDCGVAGLWRLLEKQEELQEYHSIIAVAGLDAALISVLGGLVDTPIFAVPTSVGYGMAKKGEAALHSMLVSCAQGISVMNIDNGYGAACAVARVFNMMEKSYTQNSLQSS